MTVREWIDGVSRSGGVCQSYMRRLEAAEGKSGLFRVLCDANGGRWLFERHAGGLFVPVDEFMAEFGSYVNGRHVNDYPQGYSSKFYCRSTELDIDTDTTLVYILECKSMEVYVPKNKYPNIILSAKSTADVVLGEGSRVNIELYGDATVNVVGDASRVRITKH